jgi:hypothetical protein
MGKRQTVLHGFFVVVSLAGVLAACSADATAPVASSDEAVAVAAGSGASLAASGSVRVRCERRSGRNRSKISVDGRSLVPRTGTFSARVRAAGGTVLSPSARAVAGEAEFDFDSDAGDVAAGATRISPSFIAIRSGPDVVGEILDAQGRLIASQGVDCRTR